MPMELTILLGVCAYGALWSIAAGQSGALLQLHRMFWDAFLFAGSVAVLPMPDGFNVWFRPGRQQICLLKISRVLNRPERAGRVHSIRQPLSGSVITAMTTNL